MEIQVFHKNLKTDKSKKIKLDGSNFVFINVSEDEAIHLASSLLQQISAMDSNTARLESYDSQGTYFSIAVTKFNKKLYNDLLKEGKK
jgi:hypothetical protein